MSHPVLIVGAGPVGATMALLLAHHGIDSVLLDRRTEPSSHPAAHVVSTRTVEILRQLGLEYEVRRLSAPIHQLRDIVYCTTLSGPELGRITLLDPESAEARHLEAISPTRAVNLPQNLLETLLWERLRAHPRIDFRPATTYQGHYHHHCDGVNDTVVVLQRDAGGAASHINASYLIGADGAGSQVRRNSGISLDGPLLQHMIGVHFTANLGRLLWNKPSPVIWTHTASGVGTLIVHRTPTDFVFQFPYFPPAQAASDFTEAVCRAKIHAAIGERTTDIEIHGIRSWAMTAQVADTFSSQRCFLIGDAAHRFPPTGGLGLNTGVHDAHNLAWKLAWTLHDIAPTQLLDTYTAERRPVALRNTAHAVHNIEGTRDVLTTLGLPRRGTDTLGHVAESRTFTALPRRIRSVAISALIALGSQRLRIAALRFWPGPRIRARAAAAIAGQGGHYRSWGLDLGVQYRHGFLAGEPDSDFDNNVESYTPAVAVGARLPHAWLASAHGRISTLDIVVADTLTLVVSVARSHPWITAVRRGGYPITVRAVNIPGPLFAGLNDHGRALLVRPDGHVAAILRVENGEEALSLDSAMARLGMNSKELHVRTR